MPLAIAAAVALAAASGCNERANVITAENVFPNGPVATELIRTNGLSGLIRVSDTVVKTGRNYSFRTERWIEANAAGSGFATDNLNSIDDCSVLSPEQKKFLRTESTRVETAFNEYTNKYVYAFGYSEGGPAAYPRHKE